MNAPITYTGRFIADPELFAKDLWDELDWQRRGSTPRFEYYCNEHPVPYIYGRGSGEREYMPQPWHRHVLAIKQDVEAFAGCKFEVCFLNGYANQSDHLGWHADDSPEMDDARPIAIVSLGVEREIWFRKNGSASNAVQKLKLENGSLCLMAPGMQDTHQHRIPKAGFICGSRISLTFRGYVSA